MPLCGLVYDQFFMNILRVFGKKIYFLSVGAGSYKCPLNQAC